jgi:hypothetical protein
MDQPETKTTVRLRGLLVALSRVQDLRHFLSPDTPEHDAAVAMEVRLAEEIRRLKDGSRHEDDGSLRNRD